MRLIVNADAGREVIRLSAGRLLLAIEPTGVYLENRATSERIEIARFVDETGTPRIDGDRLSAIASLSDREQLVFALLGEGLGMAEIGKRLGLSVKTIETYRARIKQKLNIDRGSQLITLAVEWNLKGRPIGTPGVMQSQNCGNNKIPDENKME